MKSHACLKKGKLTAIPHLGGLISAWPRSGMGPETLTRYFLAHLMKRPLKRDSKISFAMNLRQGIRPEPEVTNKEFLLSLYDYGIYLRVLAALDHLSQLKDPTCGPVRRFASVSGFYHQLGSHSEDIVSLLVALVAWRADRSLSLPNLLNRLVLRPESPGAPERKIYVDEKITRLISTQKRTFIDPHVFVAYLHKFSPMELVQVLGIPWRKNVSVKFVPEHQRNAYSMYPTALHEVVRTLFQPILDALRNKIKHGPQVIIANPRDCAAKRDIIEPSLSEVPNKAYLRILADGARTQEKSGELEQGDRVAPFLLDELEVLESFFYETFIFRGEIMLLTVRILLTYVLGERNLAGVPSELVSIVQERDKYFDKHMPGWRNYRG